MWFNFNYTWSVEMEDTDRRALYSIFCYVLFPFFSWFYIMYELKEMYLLSTMYISENFF